MSQWRTHQGRAHFPTTIYFCQSVEEEEACSMTAASPCMRKDNHRSRLRDVHGYEDGDALDQKVKERTVNVTRLLFHDKCGFCTDEFDDRESSPKHIGDHFAEGKDIKDWEHRCESDHESLVGVHFRLPLPTSIAIRMKAITKMVVTVAHLEMTALILVRAMATSIQILGTYSVAIHPMVMLVGYCSQMGRLVGSTSPQDIHLPLQSQDHL